MPSVSRRWSRARRRPSAGSSSPARASTPRGHRRREGTIAQIQPGLPQGVSIVPFYDRSDLIEQSVDTLRHALIEEILLVTLAHVVFLMHFRSILIVTIPLPLAVLTAFLGMYYAGITSNIMSLAGIAIAIGVLVDAGIVVTENAFRFMEQRQVDPRDRPARVGNGARVDATGWAPGVLLDGDHPARICPGFCADRTGRQAVSSARLYEDVCGACGDHHRRHPRARVVLAAPWRKISREDDNPVMRVLHRLYRPVLERGACDIAV